MAKKILARNRWFIFPNVSKLCCKNVATCRNIFFCIHTLLIITYKVTCMKIQDYPWKEEIIYIHMQYKYNRISKPALKANKPLQRKANINNVNFSENSHYLRKIELHLVCFTPLNGSTIVTQF